MIKQAVLQIKYVTRGGPCFICRMITHTVINDMYCCATHQTRQVLGEFERQDKLPANSQYIGDYK